MRIFILVLALSFGIGNVWAETINLAPTGEYATIDTSKTIEAMDVLVGTDDQARLDKLTEITNHSDQYAPPVFYLISHILFQNDQKDSALFWFYAGQLRGRFDANRCTDKTAVQAITVLNQRYGAMINPYAFQDTEKLKRIIDKVIEWDTHTPHNYDHRWINLSGMDAIQASLAALENSNEPQKPLSLPEDQWPHIHKQTQEEYLQGLNQALQYVGTPMSATEEQKLKDRVRDAANYIKMIGDGQQ